MTEFVPFNMKNTASMRRPLSDQQEACELFFQNADVESAYARLLLCVCPVCGHQMPSMPALNRHTTNEHNLSYCDLCIKHARLLPSEFLPMTKEDLAKHLFYDSKKKTGHPPCNFCNRERFYEFEDLIRHIKETHFMCDICSYSGLFEVFRQQSELFEHYESSHFVCDVCKKEDVVSYFESSDELGLHKLTKHADQSWNPIRVEAKSAHRARQHQRQPIDMNAIVPTVQFREANPTEWTGADFPCLAPTDPTTQASSQLDQQSLNEFRSGLRSALQDSQRILNTRTATQKPSMAQIAGSFAPTQLSPAEEFPALCERLGNNNRSNFNESWAPPPQPSQPKHNHFAVPPKTDSTTEFPSLGNEDKKQKNKNKKGPALVDFSDLSTARRADQVQPLSASAQRILSGQALKDKPINKSKPSKKDDSVRQTQQTAGPSSSIHQVRLVFNSSILF
ncbi:hypothetical protein Ciccas_001645 [Cichlidogyrus casuarinus]|uniref:C2H2-type domain-containing protein n=1 Tax=Cichlidogyrus casuarinus TaxID=1844966 RepID=A0ABD2QJZ1_9PLAT